MKLISILIIGLLFFYFFTKTDRTPDKKMAKPEIPTIEKPAAPKDAVHRTVKINLSRSEAVSSWKPNFKTSDTEIQIIGNVSVEEAAKKAKVQFSLKNITRMESEWQSLRNQIQVSKEKDGWRVKMIAPNTVLARTGLEEGNLITYDSIRALGHDGNPSLPDRVSTILKHVSDQ